MRHVQRANVCVRLLDSYAGLGKPIQITELTIPAFSEDPSDEAMQAESVRNLYSIWFSHKAMETIIYWDLSDASTWLPTLYDSLCRKDISPKPAYNAICDLPKSAPMVSGLPKCLS